MLDEAEIRRRILLLEFKANRLDSDSNRLMFDSKALHNESQELRCEILELKDQYEAMVRRSQER